MTSQELIRLLRSQGNVSSVDPLNHPSFAPVTYGDADSSLGQPGPGSFFDFTGIPGMESLTERLRQSSDFQNSAGDAGGGDPYAFGSAQDGARFLKDLLSANGYSLNEQNQEGLARRWIEGADGNLVGDMREVDTTDRNAGLAMSLLGAAGGSFVGGLAGLGSIGSGALAGGVAAGAQDADLGSIAKGAALGGLAGYGMEQFAGAPDAMGDYMRTGASEGSTIGNAYTGAGGQAGAVGANSIAAQMAIPSDFDPSSLFQNVADPTAALQPLPEIGQLPGPMPGMSPGGLGSIPQGQFPPMGNDITQMLQNLQLPEVPTMPWQSLPYEQTVEIPGQRVPPDATGQLPSTLPATPAALDPIAPTGAGPAASLTAGLPSLPAVPAAVGGSLLSNLPAGVKTAIEVGLPIAGAIAGSQPSGGGTATEQRRTDPRIDPAIYEQFLPEWSKQFAASNGGVNDQMRAGWNQQLGLLNDPQIAQQLSGFRNNGLLSTPIAGNPFNGGGMNLQSGGQGLLSGMGGATQGGQGGNAIGPSAQPGMAPEGRMQIPMQAGSMQQGLLGAKPEAMPTFGGGEPFNAAMPMPNNYGRQALTPPAAPMSNDAWLGQMANGQAANMAGAQSQQPQMGQQSAGGSSAAWLAELERRSRANFRPG